MPRINSFLVGLCVLMAATAVSAQKPPPSAPKPPKEPKLKIGDTAPPLVVEKWLVGKEVKGFEKDTVYVVTYAGASTPFGVATLSDLSDKHAGKGLVVVGVQSPNYGGVTWDDKKLEKELAFYTTSAKESGASYPVGWEKERKMWDAYFEMGGPLVAFVIDKAGKIAYSGPEGTAAYVAVKVRDGTWKGKADADAMTKAMEDLQKYMTQLGQKVGQPDKLDDRALKLLQEELPALERMFKDAPYLALDPQAWQMRLAVHLVAKSHDVAEAIISEKIAAAVKHKDKGTLGQLVGFFKSGPLKPDPKSAKIVDKVTDAYAPFAEPADWPVLIEVSKKYGNNDKVDTT